MAWSIRFTSSAKKNLAKIDKPEARRIILFLRERIEPIENPRSLGKALSGRLGTFWRYRIGKYRLICEIRDQELIILVIRIENRKDVYR
ncbi:MAG: type II toxin-antitoxin system RelE/ParE family toxin [Spirochaetia bacterium]